MKVLKIIGIVVLVLVLIVVALGLIAPKGYNVERSIVINAPKDLVFRHMQYWRYWNTWSPWAEQDSTMKITLEGVDGQKDSKYIWAGDPKKTGNGEMTNTGVTAGEEMTYHLHFITPWESYSDGFVRVAETDSGTLASWGFSGGYPFPWNIMLLFMPMDKMIGPDFERGMELLKTVVERQAAKMENLKVDQVQLRSANYAAIRQNVTMSDMKSFFSTSYAEIMKVIQESGAQMVGAPVAIYYSWDEATGIADVAAGIPVVGKVAAGNVQMILVPAANALAINFYGPYEESELAHLVMESYLKKNNLSFKWPVMEEYITDPTSEPDPNKWLTKIIYLVE